jgi:hypothetical protein
MPSEQNEHQFEELSGIGLKSVRSPDRHRLRPPKKWPLTPGIMSLVGVCLPNRQGAKTGNSARLGRKAEPGPVPSWSYLSRLGRCRAKSPHSSGK